MLTSTMFTIVCRCRQCCARISLMWPIFNIWLSSMESMLVVTNARCYICYYMPSLHLLTNIHKLDPESEMYTTIFQIQAKVSKKNVAELKHFQRKTQFSAFRLTKCLLSVWELSFLVDVFALLLFILLETVYPVYFSFIVRNILKFSDRVSITFSIYHTVSLLHSNQANNLNICTAFIWSCEQVEREFSISISYFNAVLRIKSFLMLTKFDYIQFELLSFDICNQLWG